ncbi:response regulator transcription factor [Mastigocladus laminosus UU774]|nr:response regulator transcription factor [Mastigocladus laminosus UU774]
MTESTPVILLLDYNRRNLELLSQFLSQQGYQAIATANLEEFDQILTSSSAIDLALIDISGFNQQIWDSCEKLRNQGICFLVISPRQSAAIQQESVTHGARNMFVKPLVLQEFLGVIRSLVGR